MKKYLLAVAAMMMLSSSVPTMGQQKKTPVKRAATVKKTGTTAKKTVTPPQKAKPAADINYNAVHGDLGIFDLKGPVKSFTFKNQWGETTRTFDKSGTWLTKDGQSLKQIYSKGIKRDNKGRLIKGIMDADGNGEEYYYNAAGQIIKRTYHEYDTTEEDIYTYDSSGKLLKMRVEEGGMDASEPYTEVYEIQATDKYGNWTKRITKIGNEKSVVTRSIIYYQDIPAQSNTSTLAVDLGLSVKWASMNIGAKKPEDKGDSFAWGEVKPKTSYTYDNYAYRVPNNRKDCVDIGSDICGTKYDAAHEIWGGEWRMPTEKELEELFKKCKVVDMENGWKFIGPNGKSIFMPYTESETKDGYYWTGTRESVETLGETKKNYGVMLYFCHKVDVKRLDYRNNISRYEGICIRPVCK